MKSAFFTVNGVIAARDGVSYTAAAALTGVPIMVSALTGMASLILGRMYGNRPVYLVSAALILVGCLWNVFVADSFAQNMAARVFQGLGWGAFDSLVLNSIQDTFFVRPVHPCWSRKGGGVFICGHQD